MSLYLPNGIFKDEVVDPDQLSEEWADAKKVIDRTSAWQFFARGSDYDSLAADGAGVRVMQKQRGGFVGAGRGANLDGEYLTEYGRGVNGYVPWLIPYLKGFQEVWDGSLALEWTSSSSELVLVGCSMWAYRLSSEGENWGPEVAYPIKNYTGSDHFGKNIEIRTQLGLKLDGTVIEGSGPGTNVATNAPESFVGAGTQQKGIVTSTQSIHLLRAGTHRLTPVAGQGPSTYHPGQSGGAGAYHMSTTLVYYGGLEEENTGVAVVNARVHAIRFPRGKFLGD